MDVDWDSALIFAGVWGFLLLLIMLILGRINRRDDD